MKSENVVSAVLRRLIFIGFSAQIILGFSWIIKNFLYVQLFGDTAFYVKVSSTLECDEYTGVLYPAVLLLIRALGELTHLRWYSLMYLIQIALVTFASFYLLKQCGFANRKPWYCLWGAFVLLTFPLSLQVHMAILPNSFSLSFLLLETAFYLIARKSKYLISGKNFAFEIGRVCLFWLLAALTENRNFYIGAIFIIALLAKVTYAHLKKHKKGLIYPIVIALIFAALFIGMRNLYQTKGAYGRPQKSIELALFDRTAWKSTLYREASQMEILTLNIDEEIMHEVSLYPHDVRDVLEPEIEKVFGTEGAKAVYLEVSRKVLEDDRAELLHDVVIDAAGYACAPVLVKMLLQKNSYVSDTIRNFDIFKRNAPILSKYYLDFSLLWFEITLVIAVVLWILSLIFEKSGKYREKNSEKNIDKCIDETETKYTDKKGYNKVRRTRFRCQLGAVVLIAVTCFLIVVLGVMRGSGLYDYKEAAYITSMWLVFILCVANYGEAK